MGQEIYLTRAGYEKLRLDLDQLKTTERRRIAKAIGEARLLGDISENAEYDAAKNEQAKNEYDIVQLENELKNAHVIDESAIDTTTVGVGATVKLTNMGTKEKYTFQIVGSAEADPMQGRISNESPIGKAVLGHKAGDVVEVVTPGGTLKLKVSSIGK